MRLDERVEGKFTSVEKRVCPQLTKYIAGLQGGELGVGAELTLPK